MKLIRLLLTGLIFIYVPLYAQQIKVYPTNWWTGMKHDTVQLLLKGNTTAFHKNKISIRYPGIEVLGTHTFDNGKYLAVDVYLSPATLPGTVMITAGNEQIPWPLVAKPTGTYAQGVTSADVIYFLLPDRFSNGDSANDRVPGMRDQSLNRHNYYARHGGDIQGILQHLDYLEQLGVTALWTTPVVENDMPGRTEHGYAVTDHYTMDPRYGGAAMYKKLGAELHKRGMKLIEDAVYNHAGAFHLLVQELPAKDWLNQWPSFTKTSAKEQTLFDPYATVSDIRHMSDGWFVPEMPDWNQRNPFVANFILQHALWYVAEFGVDGVRIDTYIYNDLEFSNRCNASLMAEFPTLTLFGEAWVHGTSNQAYFAENNINTSFRSNLPGVIDFQCLFTGIIPALTEEPGYASGVMQLYNTLSNDFLYKNPMRNVLFLDNHDFNRFFSTVNGNVDKQKIGYQWLLTSRGIPQLYYGSEVLMKGVTNPDGLVRLDFPGGWVGDTVNAFTGDGLTADQLSVQSLVRSLANFRKTSSALKTGKLMQFVPQDGLYVYFRYDAQQTVMCVMNTAQQPRSVSFDRFAERTAGFGSARNVLTQQVLQTGKPQTIPGMQMWVLELKK